MDLEVREWDEGDAQRAGPDRVFANAASGAVARAAGFEHIEDRPDEIAAPAETGVERVWQRERERDG